MEQIHEILLNRFFSATTVTAGVGGVLQYSNEYYLNPTGEADKVVDFSNVRGFLSNENNQKIVKAYFSFLTSSTIMNSLIPPAFSATAAFKEIYYDDEKLADSFNNFYNSSIARGQDSSFLQNPDITKNSITNQLIAGDGKENVIQTIYHNNYYLQSPIPVTPAYSPVKSPFTAATLSINDGDRNLTGEERIVGKSLEQAYYINIFLERSYTQMSRMSFEVCEDFIFKAINNSSTFSQNIIDKIKHDDYFQSTTKGIDNYDLKTTESHSLHPQQNNGENLGYEYGYDYYQQNGTAYVNTTGTPLIQCFVDPNFKTNENETWSDDVSLQDITMSDISTNKIFNLNSLAKIDSSLIQDSDLLQTDFVVSVISAILFNNSSFKLSGSLALSKQGTVYKNYLKDVDFSVTNNNQTASMIISSDVTIENFDLNNMPTQVIGFINSIYSAGLHIEKIKKVFIQEPDYYVNVFSVFTNLIQIDLILTLEELPANEFNFRLLNYDYILERKIDRNHKKDYVDLESFIPFFEPISINKNSFIKPDSEFATLHKTI